MKKISIAALALLMPLSALCACGGTTPTLVFNANWYKNTALKANLGGTLEQLEYEVSFEPASQDGFRIEYTDGVYKTKLENAKVDLDNDTREGYILTTELTLSVRFCLGSEKSEIFQDSVHTQAQFLSAAEGLKPLRSSREVKSHVPVDNAPGSLADSYLFYEYTYTTEYNDDLTAADVVFNNLTDGTNRSDSYDIEGAGTFLDNEQILFALRGLDFSSAPTFRSVNYIAGKTQEVAVESLAETTYEESFEADGKTVTAPISAYDLTLGYKGKDRGLPQKLIYAKTTDSASNAYRNVLLSLEAPVLHSLGTLCYKLKTARFTDK